MTKFWFFLNRFGDYLLRCLALCLILAAAALAYRTWIFQGGLPITSAAIRDLVMGLAACLLVVIPFSLVASFKDLRNHKPDTPDRPS
ncbi:MAG: hypothetical protein KF910_09540 [Brevundimonas sp.]|uniref:hypothetical protein n=1 Tax=Brevundimonas sp. TaxID=1871086 RepID=UPI0025C05DAB|nr:hypothetical protein [Brevundimonas sp.]MBX3477841.1 hypothetical protein [Brevundimonas sp.]